MNGGSLREQFYTNVVRLEDKNIQRSAIKGKHELIAGGD